MRILKKIALLAISVLLFLSASNPNIFDDGYETSNKLLYDLNYQDDSVDYDSPESYDITVLVKFNIDRFNRDYTQIKNDDQLKTFRDSVKDYYVCQNMKVVDNLDLDGYEFDISFYAPFMEIVFDDLEEYDDKKEELISMLNDSKSVECISINYLSFDEATVNTDSCSTDYSFTTAMSDIGIPSTLTYTGNGVNVGTIESGTPDSTVNLKSDKFTRLSSYTTSHSTWVTSIIGGTSGIAQDAHLYCAGIYGSTFTGCVNALIHDYNVNVINMSRSQNHLGYYDYYCAYIDYIIRDSHCTFIKSSGNNGLETNPNISSPGCGMNVITVGSISANQNVSCFSSWYTSNNFLFKPDMVAPGEKISNIPNLIGSNSGTSFSTPMVTGVVALLMEEFPALKYNPSLVKAALHNGCVELSSQTSLFDEQCGFGLVNYQNSKDYLSNSQYNNFIIPSNGADGSTIVSYNVTVPSNKILEINANWIINSVNVEPSSSSYSPIYTQCKIKIFDIQDAVYVKTATRNSNMVFTEYINPNFTSRQYRIDIIIDGTTAGDGIEIGSLVYNVDNTHAHDYSYFWKNYTQHRTRCSCGINRFDPHVVSPNSFSYGQQYATCLLCGGLATSGLVNYDSLNQYFPRTANGSYILPNGVIVLEEDDFEAYLDGSLVFIYPNVDSYQLSPLFEDIRNLLVK